MAAKRTTGSKGKTAAKSSRRGATARGGAAKKKGPARKKTAAKKTMRSRAAAKTSRAESAGTRSQARPKVNVKDAVGLIAAAAADFAKTPTGQKLKRQAARKVVELLSKGQESIARLGERARQSRASSTAAGQRPSQRSTPKPSSKAGVKVTPSKRRPTGANRKAAALPLGIAPPSLQSSGLTQEPAAVLGNPAGTADVPPWQDKLRMKSAMGTKPIVNPGSHKGRAADR